MKNVYLLDANVFIEAKNSYYAFDIAPGFWESLIKYANEGIIRSIDWIEQEIKKEDLLSDWVDEHLNYVFESTDEANVTGQYREIMNWVNNCRDHYKDYAIAEFAGGADGWLVAYAKVNDCVLVTNEALNLERKNQVPIPVVCEEFEVNYINTFQMLRELSVKLIKE